MSESFFERPLVPVANEDNAAEIAAALAPHLDDADSTVIAVHVIEKAGGALDKASVEQRELDAQDIFAVATDGLSDTEATVETRILYGTDVVETIIDAAHEENATAIVFSPREGSRWERLLSGDVSQGLLDESDMPVLVLPDPEVSDT